MHRAVQVLRDTEKAAPCQFAMVSRHWASSPARPPAAQMYIMPTHHQGRRHNVVDYVALLVHQEITRRDVELDAEIGTQSAQHNLADSLLVGLELACSMASLLSSMR